MNPVVVRLAASAMRTRFEFVLSASDASEADLRAAGEEALEEIHRVESWLSRYREDAVLYAVNHGAPSAPIRVAAPLFAFLQTATTFSRQTGGAFDLTVGPLVQLWRKAGEGGVVPAAAEIDECLALVGMERVVALNETDCSVCLTQTGANLDPGGMGKGYALDRAADILREAGIRSALLHGGTSSVVAIGAPPGNPDGWPIAIQDPTRPDRILSTIVLCDRALGISAVHGRSFRAGGRSYGHVLDPRTGYPVEKTVLAACHSSSATVADAVSTAILVLGADGMADLQAHFPEIDILAVEAVPDSGEFTTTATGECWNPSTA